MICAQRQRAYQCEIISHNTRPLLVCRRPAQRLDLCGIPRARRAPSPEGCYRAGICDIYDRKPPSLIRASAEPVLIPKEPAVKYAGHDTLKTRRTLDVGGKSYVYYSLPAAAQAAGLG